MKTNTTQQNVPRGWVTKSLADLGEFKTGGVDKKIKQDEKPVKLVNYMDVYKRRFIDDSINFMEVTASDSEIKISQVKVGDMLFTPSSETPDDIGHSAVVATDLPDTLFSYHLARLRFNEEYDNKIDINFRAYFCNSRDVLRQFEKMSVGATRYTISKGKFESIQVLIPESKKEQQKIAEILGTVDEDIAKTQGVIDATEKLKRGLMQQLFTRGIGHTKFKETKLGNIPDSWEVQELGKVCDVRDGTHSSPKYHEEGVPLITSKNLVDSELDFSNVSLISKTDYQEIERRSKVDDADILFGMIGTIGNPVIVKKDREFAIKNVALIKFAGSKMDNVFVLNFLKSAHTDQQFKQKTGGSTQKFIALGVIREILITVPSVAEQKKIAEIFSAVDEKILVNKKLKARLTLLKKGLMQDLLSGVVRTINL